ncbi:inositol-3-phosphate synthase [Phreatobacter sp. AB_2022a]|uniref:inositol-3-phosphate synthase n=1 Tax=Phreatobacter sp. AB_2022a TaxID=3003134 RepID=UPI002286DBFC|nr:inositol-3-phosphate synthase [Phreatobacter sp. AB_2022a]MCZ0732944.1 inositol-3-phosphate synthase [Phreatobacter sp. AB_2022a]
MSRAVIRVAIVGVGNCASSFVQGLNFYKDAKPDEAIPGLMNVEVGPYHIRDIEVVAAFDIDGRKVGHDLSEAIFAAPNNTYKFARVPETGVIVQRGPTLDGIGKHLVEVVHESTEAPVDVAAALKAARADVIISYLPVGSQKASEFYAEQALAAGCGLINCVPVFIASDPAWAKRFAEKSLPIVGDDIKSQVGATILHRVLARLYEDRGVKIERTYQLNFGGNTDFLNMLERERLKSKKISKTQAVNSQIDVPLASDRIHIGPSDFVPFLDDRKIAYIRLEGTGFGGVPLNAEVKLEVWDSPNSAGVVIDAVRCAKIALDRGVGGPVIGPSSYFMKSPPQQFTDPEARDLTVSFIAGA